MVYAWHPSPPPDNGRRGIEGKRKRSQFLAAGMLAPARQNAGMAGLRQWGRATVPPPPERSSRSQGCMMTGERKEERAEEKFDSEKQRFCSAGACISDRDWVADREREEKGRKKGGGGA